MTHHSETRHFHLNGRLYTGKAVFIHGYNGYEHTEDDGLFCALLSNGGSVQSCWMKNGELNKLLDQNNEPFIDRHRGGCIVFVHDGVIDWKTGYYQ